MDSSHRGLASHPGRFVYVDPIATRAAVRITTDLRDVGFESTAVADRAARQETDLLLADVDPTRSLVKERTATQTRPLLK